MKKLFISLGVVVLLFVPCQAKGQAGIVRLGAKSVRQLNSLRKIESSAYKISKLVLQDLKYIGKFANVRHLLNKGVIDGRITTSQMFRFQKVYSKIDDGDKILLLCLKKKSCNLNKPNEAAKLLNKANYNKGNFAGNAINIESRRRITKYEKNLINSGKTKKVNGKNVSQRDQTFDKNAKDAKGRTNCQRMNKGFAPIGHNNTPVELHHLKQQNNGIIIEMASSEHNEASKILHRYTNKSEIERDSFNDWRKNYWQERGKGICQN
jgi:hypothetical protein